MPRRAYAVLGLFLFTSLFSVACKPEGCLGGGAHCQLPSPCQKLSFACSGDTLDVRTLAGTDPRPGGLDALGANGDVLLGNGQVTAVISAIGNQNYLDINGGSLIDFAVAGQNDDAIAELTQITGILPADQAKYTSLQIIDERPTRVGVQLKGTLSGHPDIPIATLYEVRPCEPGLRVRTEVLNGSADPQLFFLSDGFYWSLRSDLPFTPNDRGGYAQPSFGLSTIDPAFRTFPYVAASLQSVPGVSYGAVACSEKEMQGFNSTVVSAVGLPRTIVQPRDYQVYERFLTVASSNDVSGAVNTMLGVRQQLFNEGTARLKGTVQLPGAIHLDNSREVSILVTKGTLASGAGVDAGTPVSGIVPQDDGSFVLTVPSNQTYVLTATSFGRPVVQKEIQVTGDADVGAIVLPGTVPVTVNVSEAIVGSVITTPINAEVFVVPADAATEANTQGSFYGQFDTCSPFLGTIPGPSPVCDRFLVSNGAGGTPVGTTVEIPVGHYYLYAFHGPFYTLGRQEVTFTDTTPEAIHFVLEALPLEPLGTLGADLHVHGAASFDSSIPDLDRVLSFDATGLSVLVATDHDVVHDYGPMIKALGLDSHMSAVTGVETTGHVPYLAVPGDPYPRVIGHYNFWPLKEDVSKPRRGAPFDEFLEPGALYDRIVDQGLFASPVPIFELNHPWADSQFGRDLGFPRAIGLNTLNDLPKSDDGTNAGLYVRAPNGRMTNDGHNAQEVINGTALDQMLQYRAFWFFMLNQGKLKTGTANSDSHSLVDNTVGVPRNIITANTFGGPLFNVDTMNQAIIDGHVLGTNGPIIEATMDGADGKQHPYGLAVFAPAPNGALHLRISAAPWVPIEEVRIIVNGKLAQSFSGLSAPADPFGDTGLLRYQGDVALKDILPASGDVWVVIEAGQKLQITGDLGGERGVPDGIPDTTDNNGDGKVDASDVAPGGTYGPLNNPPIPTSVSDPRFHYAHVLNGGYPYAFTNPFVLDRNGNGGFDAPGVKGGQ